MLLLITKMSSESFKPPPIDHVYINIHPTNFHNKSSLKQRIRIISSQPISRRSLANSFHDLSMNSVSIDVIGEFWRATKRELVRIA